MKKIKEEQLKARAAIFEYADTNNYKRNILLQAINNPSKATKILKDESYYT